MAVPDWDFNHLQDSPRHVVCNLRPISRKKPMLITCVSPPEKYGSRSDEVSFRSPPAHKRHKSSASATSPARMSAQVPANQSAATSEDVSARAAASAMSATSSTPANPRKRRASNNAGSPSAALTSAPGFAEASMTTAPPLTPDTATKKKGRTNTPWTPEEEQKLQQMRGENKGWSEIAKVNSRLSGLSVKYTVADLRSHFRQGRKGVSRSIGIKSAFT
jgi:hypothetical protein